MKAFTPSIRGRGAARPHSAPAREADQRVASADEWQERLFEALFILSRNEWGPPRCERIGLAATGAEVLRISTEYELGVASSRRAESAESCRHHSSGDNTTLSLRAQQEADALQFAQYMRSHGVPNFPHPTTDPSGEPGFPVKRLGVDPNGLK